MATRIGVILAIITFIVFIPYLIGLTDLFQLNIRDDINLLIWFKGSLILGIVCSVILFCYIFLVLILNRKK